MEKHNSTRSTFQKRNWCLTIAIAFFLLLTIYGISIPQKIRSIMASSPYRSFSEIPIKISVSYTTPSIPSAITTLKVTLENTSPTQPIYILKWSSPLDPHAAAVGVFVFQSTETGETAPGIGLKINYQMPPSGYFSVNDEEILKIEAGGKIEGTVEVKEHEVLLERGTAYDVRAEGRWMGIWVGDHDALGFQEGSDLLSQDFESEKIRLEIPV